jgi:hypothetical protein
MLKVIYAMAVRGFGIDPSDARSNLVPEILNDLELQGLSLSDDTVRRYIKPAIDLINRSISTVMLCGVFE